MRSTVALPALGLLLVPLVVAAGCARALGPPPEVSDLIDGTVEPARKGVGFDELAAAAARAFDEATPPQVRRALGLWLDAASLEPSRVEGWIGATRAGVWLADNETPAQTRRMAATNAVRSAQLCRLQSVDEPACAYWLAVALGVQARERRTTGRDALPRMVELLGQVARRDPLLEHAGADRVLALVYLRAPGWPAGPGDPELGLEHARRAVDLAPDYPPNHLCLAEALVALEDEAGERAYRLARDLAEEWVQDGHREAERWRAEADAAISARVGD